MDPNIARTMMVIASPNNAVNVDCRIIARLSSSSGVAVIGEAKASGRILLKTLAIVRNNDNEGREAAKLKYRCILY